MENVKSMICNVSSKVLIMTFFMFIIVSGAVNYYLYTVEETAKRGNNTILLYSYASGIIISLISVFAGIKLSEKSYQEILSGPFPLKNN